MHEATTKFFEKLNEQGFDPLLEKATGRIRIELVNGKKTDPWLVTIDKGNVAVSHKAGASETQLRLKEELFDQLVRGEENAMAAVLRGAVTIEGDPELLTLFQRILPGPPKKPARQRRTSSAKRSSR